MRISQIAIVVERKGFQSTRHIMQNAMEIRIVTFVAVAVLAPHVMVNALKTMNSECQVHMNVPIA